MDLGGVKLPASRVAGLDERHLPGEDRVVRELRLRQRNGAAAVDVLQISSELICFKCHHMATRNHYQIPRHAYLISLQKYGVGIEPGFVGGGVAANPS